MPPNALHGRTKHLLQKQKTIFIIFRQAFYNVHLRYKIRSMGKFDSLNRLSRRKTTTGKYQ